MAQDETRQQDLREPAEPEAGEPAGSQRELPAADDLVLRDEEGNYYWLKKDEYRRTRVAREVPALRRMTEQMEALTQKGVVLADVPRGSMTGVGCACYLINLAGIRRPSAPESPQPAVQPGPPPKSGA